MQLTAEQITTINRIAREAGAKIMPYFRAEHGARKKQDRSPVTDADIASHDCILAQLAKEFPDIPIVSEEDSAPPAETGDGLFFLVDPLDGTRGFVRGDDEFTVNIGLVKNRRPIFGTIYAPAQDALYWGGKTLPPLRLLRGSKEEPIHCRKIPDQGVIITRSRSSPSTASSEFMEKYDVGEIRAASSAIKFCWVAEGSADIYPRFGRTMEWDTAAGEAILEAAGGSFTNIDGTPFIYGKAGFENPGFIAKGA